MPKPPHELLPLCDIPLFVLAQVDGLLPLLTRLLEAPGYSENIGRPARPVLTERGWRGVEVGLHMAQDSHRELNAMVGYHTNPTEEHRLVDAFFHDGANVFAVAVATLAGLREHPDWFGAIYGLETLLRRLEGDARSAMDVTGRVYAHDAGLPQEPVLGEARHGLSVVK